MELILLPFSIGLNTVYSVHVFDPNGNHGPALHDETLAQVDQAINICNFNNQIVGLTAIRTAISAVHNRNPLEFIRPEYPLSHEPPKDHQRLKNRLSAFPLKNTKTVVRQYLWWVESQSLIILGPATIKTNDTWQHCQLSRPRVEFFLDLIDALYASCNERRQTKKDIAIPTSAIRV